MFHQIAASLAVVLLGGCAAPAPPVTRVQMQPYVPPAQYRPRQLVPAPPQSNVARQLDDVDRAIQAAQRRIDEHRQHDHDRDVSIK
jgi:hypothetical protein